MKFLYSLTFAIAVLFSNGAQAQLCNDPSGFLKTYGEILIGDSLALGPDCQHVQSGTGITTVPVQYFFNSKAALAASQVPPNINVATTLGYYAPGDNGGVDYIRVPGPCGTFTWRVQSADGQCWALSNRTVTPEMFGAVGDGIAYDTVAFQNIAAYLNLSAPAAVTINNKPAALYRIWQAGIAPPNLMVVTGLNGLVWNFNGSCFNTNQVFVGSAVILGLSKSSNIIINQPCYNELNWTVLSNINGGALISLGEATAPWTTNVLITDLKMTGGIHAVSCEGDLANNATATGGFASGITILNAEITNVYYGLNFQASCDNVTAVGIKGTNNGRLYFPWNVSNHHIRLSGNGGPNDQVLFKSYAYPNMSLQRRSLSNIDVKYQARLPNASPGGEIGHLQFQQVVPTVTVSNAVNNGSGFVRLTVNSTANMQSNQSWFFAAITGTTEANGLQLITVVNGTTVDLPNTPFVNGYVSGGYGSVPSSIRDVKFEIDLPNAAGVTSNPFFSSSKFDNVPAPDTLTRGYEVANFTLTGRVSNYVYPAVALIRAFDDPTLGTWVGETIRNFNVRDFVATGDGTSGVSIAAPANTFFNLENIVSSGLTWGLSGTGSSFNIMNVFAPGIIDRNTVIPATAPANQYAYSIGSDGAISFAAVTMAGLVGSLSCSQTPAFTGDVVKSAGSCATAVTTTSGVSFGQLATGYTYTNNQNGSSRIIVTNNSAGAAAAASFYATNGVGFMEFAQRGTGASTYGELQAGRAFMYGSNIFVIAPDGADFILAQRSGANQSMRGLASGCILITPSGAAPDCGSGNVATTGNVATKAPVTMTGTSGTIGANDSSIIFNPSGSFTVTFPACNANSSGRWLDMKLIAAQTVASATSNVVQQNGGAATTAVFTASIGKWARLQCNATAWEIMASN